MCACSAAQSCPTCCDPVNCSPPGSSVHGISQAGTLEWVAISSSRGSSWTRDRTRISCVSCIGRQITLPLHHLGSPEGWTDCSFSMEISMDSGKLEVIVLCVHLLKVELAPGWYWHSSDEWSFQVATVATTWSTLLSGSSVIPWT